MATKARDVSSSSSLIRIYHRLCNSSRRGISRSEFLEVYGLDEYTIFGSGNKRKAETIAKKFERAKDCLRDAGITFKHVERDGKSYYVYTPVPNPLLDWELKLEDAQFLMSLCRAWEGTELESSAHRMMRKIILSVPTLSASTRLEELEEPLQRIRLSDDSHLEEIFSAFSDHKTIDMDYGDLNTRHSENLSVWGIGYRYGNWYFAAHYPSREGSEAPKEEPNRAYIHRFERIQSMRINGSQQQQENFVRPGETFDFQTMLFENLQGYARTVPALSLDSHEQLLLDSYGVRETAVKATARGLKIMVPKSSADFSSKDLQRAQEAYRAQHNLVERLLSTHQRRDDLPEAWRKNSRRKRDDDTDRFIDMLLVLHRLSQDDAAWFEGGVLFKPATSLLQVDNGKSKSNLVSDFTDVCEDYGAAELDLATPIVFTPRQDHELYAELTYSCDDLIYQGVPLSALERAMLFFSMSAAEVLYPDDARVSRIRELLLVSYPKDAERLRGSLIFTPEHHLIPLIHRAVSQKRTLIFDYTGVQRTVDICSLIFENNRFYLHGLWREAADSNAWRNFALDRIKNARLGSKSHQAVAAKIPNTPHLWSRQQQTNTEHPYVRVKIHVESLRTERRESTIRTLKRRSTHVSRSQPSKPETPLIYHELHYYPGESEAGLEQILHFVVAYGGALEILEPEPVRSLLKDRLMSLLA